MEYRATINGMELLIREPVEDDAEDMLNTLKTACDETDFLARSGSEVNFTVDDEREFIKNFKNSDTDIMLVAIVNGEYAGNCSLMGSPLLRARHRRTFGIALSGKFTGMGIGTAMTERIIEVAREKGIEQIELEVVADNAKAIALYKKFGFEACGRLPRNMKYPDGRYADAIFMVKFL